MFLCPLATLLQKLRMATGQENTSVRSLLAKFLQGSWIPCHELFDMVKVGFSPLIDLSDIDGNSF